MMFARRARLSRAGPHLGEESIVTQEERLAKRDALRSEIVKLEESIRALLEQEEEMLRDCSHTYAGGKSALVGGRVKVCVHCGRSVQGKDEKLWG
jgi:transposase